MNRLTFAIKVVSLISLLSIHFNQLIAQDKHLTNPNADQLAFVDMYETKGTFFLTGNRLNTNKSNTDQSNLFRNYWLPGVVQFKSGKQYGEATLNFDLANNQLLFNNEGKANIFAEPVRGFTLSDTIEGLTKIARFNNGYPAFGKQTTETFYQVLAYGKYVHLLKHFSKYIIENQGYNTITTFNFKIIEDYFMYNVANGDLKLIKKTPSFFAKSLPALETKISKITTPKKLTEKDLINLVNTINTF